MMPPNSQSGLVPMRFWRSNVRSLFTPASSNWCCRTGTNVGSKERLLLLLSPLLDALEKSSSYASVGLDFVLSNRTGIGCSGLDAGGGDMFAEGLMWGDGGSFGEGHLMAGQLVIQLRGCPLCAVLSLYCKMLEQDGLRQEGCHRT